jgi:hypothetical protein
MHRFDPIATSHHLSAIKQRAPDLLTALDTGRGGKLARRVHPHRQTMPINHG